MSDEGELNHYVAARRTSLQAPDAATLHAAAIRLHGRGALIRPVNGASRRRISLP